jgi:hypothetical protein
MTQAKFAEFDLVYVVHRQKKKEYKWQLAQRKTESEFV